MVESNSLSEAVLILSLAFGAVFGDATDTAGEAAFTGAATLAVFAAERSVVELQPTTKRTIAEDIGSKTFDNRDIDIPFLSMKDCLRGRLGHYTDFGFIRN